MTCRSTDQWIAIHVPSEEHCKFSGEFAVFAGDEFGHLKTSPQTELLISHGIQPPIAID